MIRTRRMNLADLDTVLDWAADEGWNPGLGDAEAFLAADPEGFFVAEDGGTPVAAISVVNHSPRFAFLGLYLCIPSHRGRGIGHALWNHAISHAGDRTIGLDGVPDQQANYVKSGFQHAGETTRYAGLVDGQISAAIRTAEAADIANLVARESKASGWEKNAYLSSWFTGAETRKTFILETGGHVRGFVTVRQCRSGAKIGPLCAADEDAAIALLHHAASAFGTTIMIDVPASAAPLERVCRRIGLAPSFHTARMYRGPSHSAQADWYSVATLELG